MQRIEEMMTTDVETVGLNDSIYDVAQRMKELNVGAIPVVDGNQLVGIVTDRDIVIRGLAENIPATEPVQKVMTVDVITIKPEQTVRHAVHLMSRHQVRRLPVLKDGQLVGIVALGDLAVREEVDSQAKTALAEISEPVRSYDFLQ